MVYGVVHKGSGTGWFEPAGPGVGFGTVLDAEGAEVVVVIPFPVAVGVSPYLFKVGSVLVDYCWSGFFLKAIHICHMLSPS